MTPYLVALLGVAALDMPPGQIEQRLQGEQGKPVPLAVETGSRPDCSLGEVPKARVIMQPAHGSLSVREGQLRRRGANCPASIGYVVLYVPEPDFIGSDVVTLEVIDPDGPAVTRIFDITVEPEDDDDPPAAS